MMGVSIELPRPPEIWNSLPNALFRISFNDMCFMFYVFTCILFKYVYIYGLKVKVIVIDINRK